jgi:hypothetical protein
VTTKEVASLPCPQKNLMMSLISMLWALTILPRVVATEIGQPRREELQGGLAMETQTSLLSKVKRTKTTTTASLWMECKLRASSERRRLKGPRCTRGTMTTTKKLISIITITLTASQEDPHILQKEGRTSRARKSLQTMISIIYLTRADQFMQKIRISYPKSLFREPV